MWPKSAACLLFRYTPEDEELISPITPVRNKIIGLNTINIAVYLHQCHISGLTLITTKFKKRENNKLLLLWTVRCVSSTKTNAPTQRGKRRCVVFHRGATTGLILNLGVSVTTWQMFTCPSLCAALWPERVCPRTGPLGLVVAWTAWRNPEKRVIVGRSPRCLMLVASEKTLAPKQRKRSGPILVGNGYVSESGKDRRRDVWSGLQS